MKINLAEIDRTQFIVKEGDIGGDRCYLIKPLLDGVKWTEDNLIFRSSLWNGDGEPISLGFRKFPNLFEMPEVNPFDFSQRYEAILKVDGSCLIISKYKGKIIARTRGTLDARNLEMNGDEIDKLILKYPNIVDLREDTCPFTYLYEWVSPRNRIVLEYEEMDIYLIGIVNHHDYSMVANDKLDIIAKDLGVKRPERYSYSTFQELLDDVKLWKGREGVCIYYDNGQHIRKVKSDHYLMLHRLMSYMGNIEKVVDAFIELGMPEYDRFLEVLSRTLDYEVVSRITEEMKSVCEAKKDIEIEIVGIRKYLDRHKDMDRKDFAVHILKHKPKKFVQGCFQIRYHDEFNHGQYKKMIMERLKVI